MRYLARFYASGAREQRGGEEVFCPLEALERRRVFVHWGCHRGGGGLGNVVVLSSIPNQDNRKFNP